MYTISNHVSQIIMLNMLLPTQLKSFSFLNVICVVFFSILFIIEGINTCYYMFVNYSTVKSGSFYV